VDKHRLLTSYRALDYNRSATQLHARKRTRPDSSSAPGLGLGIAPRMDAVAGAKLRALLITVNPSRGGVGEG
jgi:hypothetical protein